MTDTLGRLETLVREAHIPEENVLSLAFQVGVRQLWREHILGRFLKGQISEDEAVETVGIDLVQLAARQHKAMLEDLEWALRP